MTTCTDLIARLPEDERQAFLAAMKREESEQVRQLLSYPPGSAGGIMTNRFVWGARRRQLIASGSGLAVALIPFFWQSNLTLSLVIGSSLFVTLIIGTWPAPSFRSSCTGSRWIRPWPPDR